MLISVASKQFFAGIGCPDCFHIVQFAERNPVVQSQEENVEGLQEQQRVEHNGRLPVLEFFCEVAPGFHRWRT